MKCISGHGTHQMWIMRPVLHSLPVLHATMIHWVNGGGRNIHLHHIFSHHKALFPIGLACCKLDWHGKNEQNATWMHKITGKKNCKNLGFAEHLFFALYVIELWWRNVNLKKNQAFIPNCSTILFVPFHPKNHCHFQKLHFPPRNRENTAQPPLLLGGGEVPLFLVCFRGQP